MKGQQALHLHLPTLYRALSLPSKGGIIHYSPCSKGLDKAGVGRVKCLLTLASDSRFGMADWDRLEACKVPTEGKLHLYCKLV